MYVKVDNGSVVRFPYTVGELRRDNPLTSFPKAPSEKTLMSWGVFKVTTASQPEFNPRTEKLQVADFPMLSEEGWVLSVSATPKTTDEISAYDDSVARECRALRGQLLQDTDWWALADNSEMTEEQRAYRQALRDVTGHVNWPHLDEADWPTKP